MVKSAADEISEWADQCRRWAKRARTQDQRRTLQCLERLLDDAALEAELNLSAGPSRSFARTKS